MMVMSPSEPTTLLTANMAHPYRPPADLSRFYVVTVISNPKRFMRRYELYWRFRAMCECAGVHLITVEQAFGERAFMVTDAADPHHVQVRSFEELWLKENLVNLGIERATQHGATKVAWIDADCGPMQPPRRWFEETWHALQHYEFVQMWGSMIDVDDQQEAVESAAPSFMSNYIRFGTPNPETLKHHHHKYPYGGKSFGRPGLAWAANIDALNKVGRLIDYSILGAGDWYMAWALIGSVEVVLPGNVNSSQPYVDRLLQWQILCERWIKRDVGYVPGTLWHDWHGDKKHRRYNTRNEILLRAHYNPDVDVKYDSFGLLTLETWEPRQIRLRDDIRAYFAQRSEDSLSG